jgi:hypothetical protein
MMLQIPRHLALGLGLACVLLVGAAAGTSAQVGPPMNRIYANGELFTGITAPRDLPNNGKFDTIYVLGNGFYAVSEAAPGDQDYNGGRWEARIVTWNSIPPTQFKSADQIESAAAAGQISIGEVVRRFECPLIPLRGNQ